MAFPLSDPEHAAIKQMIDGQTELIVAAAVRSNGVIIMVERPGRHGNCINFLSWLKLDHKDQGFVTNRGRFVDREEAARIVGAAGQTTTQDFGPDYPRALFSEDVWNDWDETPAFPVRPEEVFGPGETNAALAEEPSR